MEKIKCFTLSCKSFRSNLLTALLRSRMSRFSLTKFRSLAAHLYGFTLAEVLITLAILGVVAAISIPNIIQQYQKKLTITKLQKAYASMEKMATNIAVSSGCVGRDLNCTGLFNIKNADDFINKFIELSGVNVKKMEKEYIGVKNLNYKLSSKTDYVGARIIVTKDNIAYNIVNTTTRAYDENAEHKIGRQPVIRMSVITNPNKMYDKNGNVRNYTQYTTDLIIGRDVFCFHMYDNFSVTPCLVGGGTGAWLLTALDKTGYTKSENIDKFCNPNDASLNAE